MLKQKDSATLSKNVLRIQLAEITAALRAEMLILKNNEIFFRVPTSAPRNTGLNYVLEEHHAAIIHREGICDPD